MEGLNFQPSPSAVDLFFQSKETARKMLMSSVPNYARGLRILLIDGETSSHCAISTILENDLSYKVTSTELPSLGLFMVGQDLEEGFHLVLANAKMKDTDCITFFGKVRSINRNLPVIFYFTDKETPDASTKLPLYSLCKTTLLYIHRPFSPYYFRDLWQYAIGKTLPRMGSNMEVDRGLHPRRDFPFPSASASRKGKEKVFGEQENNPVWQCPRTHTTGLLMMGDNRPHQGMGLMMRANRPHQGIGIQIRERTQVQGGRKKKVSKQTCDKRRRPKLWTDELKDKFLTALNILGDKNAGPSKILKHMKVKNLTLAQVASHLQKHKKRVKRVSDYILRPPPLSKLNLREKDGSGLGPSTPLQPSAGLRVQSSDQEANLAMPVHNPGNSHSTHNDNQVQTATLGKFHGLKETSQVFNHNHMSGGETRNNVNDDRVANWDAFVNQEDAELRELAAWENLKSPSTDEGTVKERLKMIEQYLLDD